MIKPLNGGLRLVDPGRIELPPQQCECRVIPLYYGPKSYIILTSLNDFVKRLMEKLAADILDVVDKGGFLFAAGIGESNVKRLLDPTGLHEHDTVGQADRFFYGMRDHDNGLFCLLPDFVEILVQLFGSNGVERRKGFIKQ